MRPSTVSRWQDETLRFFANGWRLRQVSAGLRGQVTTAILSHVPRDVSGMDAADIWRPRSHLDMLRDRNRYATRASR